MKILLASLSLAGIVGLAGWMYYEQRTDAAPKIDTLSVSFMCADNSHFVAEFPGANTLNIFVDGTKTHTITGKTGTQNRYEDRNFVYSFAGESVTVTDKAASSSVVCMQPIDTNNAPFNFGDGQRSPNEKDAQTALVHTELVGTWRSTTDKKFVRIYDGNGTVIDYYDGKQVGNPGKWQIFTDENAPATVFFPLEATAIYIRHIGDGGFLHFKIATITNQTLDVTYLDKGSELTFKKEPSY